MHLQGDTVAILDSNGTAVVQYKYDAWGKPISKTGSMASTLGKINPFRYRGYVYDEETGLYYLRSRYYSPEICRFSNADGFIVNNLFQYCSNRPISYVDQSGYEERKLHDFTSILNQDLLGKESKYFAPLGNNNISNSFLSSTNPTIGFVEILELAYFAYSMMDGNMLSYKNKSVWDETFPELAFIESNEKFIFRGMEISREDYGNLSFGYLGLSAGYSKGFLLFGAGVYKQAKTVARNQGTSLVKAVLNHPFEILDRVFNLKEDEYGNQLILGNHLNDYIMISYGFAWYDQDHE